MINANRVLGNILGNISKDRTSKNNDILKRPMNYRRRADGKEGLIRSPVKLATKEEVRNVSIDIKNKNKNKNNKELALMVQDYFLKKGFDGYIDGKYIIKFDMR